MNIWMWVIVIVGGIVAFIWYQNKQMKATIQNMHQLIEQSGGAKATELALEMVEAGFIDDGRKALIRGVELGNLGAANHLGTLITAAREAGKAGPAEDEAERFVMGQSPKFRGAYLMGAGREDEAVRMLQQASDGDDEEAAITLAAALANMNRDDEATAILEAQWRNGSVEAAVHLAHHYDTHDQIEKSVEVYRFLRDKGAESQGISLDAVIRQREQEISKRGAARIG